MHHLGLADKCCLDFPRILQNTSITCVYQNLLSIIQREHTIWKYEQDIKGRRKNKFNTQKLKDELGPKEEEELLSDHLSLLNSYFSLSVFVFNSNPYINTLFIRQGALKRGVGLSSKPQRKNYAERREEKRREEKKREERERREEKRREEKRREEKRREEIWRKTLGWLQPSREMLWLNLQAHTLHTHTHTLIPLPHCTHTMYRIMQHARTEPLACMTVLSLLLSLYKTHTHSVRERKRALNRCQTLTLHPAIWQYFASVPKAIHLELMQQFDYLTAAFIALFCKNKVTETQSLWNLRLHCTNTTSLCHKHNCSPHIKAVTQQHDLFYLLSTPLFLFLCAFNG